MDEALEGDGDSGMLKDSVKAVEDEEGDDRVMQSAWIAIVSLILHEGRCGCYRYSRE